MASLNVLVSAAVQEPEENKKRKKRVKVEDDTSSVADSTKKQHGGSSALISPSPTGSASFNMGGEDEEEKQKKRRAQIAEASRRSRARRKKEFQDFKEENDQLWSQNMFLRKMLQDVGVDAPPPPVSRLERGGGMGSTTASHNNSTDDEDDDGATTTPCPSPGVPTATTTLSNGSSLFITQNPAAGASTNGVSSSIQMPSAGSSGSQGQQIVILNSIPSGSPVQSSSGLQWVLTNTGTVSEVSEDGGSPTSGGFSEFCQFFEKRLSWYFTQLKQDALRSFATQLPYEEKNKIAGLQVRLALAENISPTSSVNASRQASANNAEQVVNQDKNVRL